MPSLAQLSLLDGIAVFAFFAMWAGYARYHRRQSRRVATLMGIMHGYRREWMAQVLRRDNRLIDAAVLANLSNSSTFFASTTLLILGGLLALLGAKEKIVSVVADLPFAVKTPEPVWEIKIVLLILLFIYAFFLFTWSLRQFNFASIVIGAAPAPGVDNAAEAERFAHRTGRLVSLAGDSFNYGLRAYYFALAALMWFLHPLLLIVATAAVVLILWWREFRSETLKALIDD